VSPNDPRAIHVAAGSELDAVLAEAKAQPLILVRNGVRYRPMREDAADDIWAGHDPEALRRTVQEMAGSISAEEAERLKEVIHRGRDDGTRSASCPSP